jgi:hypothetical protein
MTGVNVRSTTGGVRTRAETFELPMTGVKWGRPSACGGLSGRLVRP